MQLLSVSASTSSAPLLNGLAVAPAQAGPLATGGEDFSALLDAQMADNGPQNPDLLGATEAALSHLPLTVDPLNAAMLPLATNSLLPNAAQGAEAAETATETGYQAATGKSLPFVAGLPLSSVSARELAPHNGAAVPNAQHQAAGQGMPHQPAAAPQATPSLPNAEQLTQASANIPVVAVRMAAAPAAASLPVSPQEGMAAASGEPPLGNQPEVDGAESEASASFIPATRVTPFSTMAQTAAAPKAAAAQLNASTLGQNPAPASAEPTSLGATRTAPTRDAPSAAKPAKSVALPEGPAALVASPEQANGPAVVAAAPVPTSHDGAVRHTPTAQVAAPMQDLTQILDRLTAAREAFLPATAALAVQHTDFGALSVRFDQSRDGTLTAELTAPDAETHRAVAHAMAAEKSASAGQDSFSRGQQQDSPSYSSPRQGGAERDAANGNARQQDQAASQSRKDSAQLARTAAPSSGSSPTHTGVFA